MCRTTSSRISSLVRPTSKRYCDLKLECLGVVQYDVVAGSKRCFVACDRVVRSLDRLHLSGVSKKKRREMRDVLEHERLLAYW